MNKLKALWINLNERPERDRRNEYKVLGWFLVWTGSWIAVDAAQQTGTIEGTGPTLIGTVVVCIFGVGAMLSYGRFLRQADELRRMIELDGLAVAAGLGILTAFAVSLLEQGGVIDGVGMFVIPVMMLLGYVIAVLHAFWKHS